MNVLAAAIAELYDPRQANEAWIVDKDHLFDATEPTSASNRDDAGVTGPSIAPDELVARLKADKKAGVQWKCYDDDWELYYTGRILAMNEDGTEMTYPECGEEFFAPLNDFAMPNAGAVHIKYRNPTTREWEEL